MFKKIGILLLIIFITMNIVIASTTAQKTNSYKYEIKIIKKNAELTGKYNKIIAKLDKKQENKTKINRIIKKRDIVYNKYKSVLLRIKKENRKLAYKIALKFNLFEAYYNC